MIHVCFYFQVHQPNRLRKYTFFEIGNSHFYEDEDANRSIVRKVASKCYLPANQVMLDLIEKHEGRFRIAVVFKCEHNDNIIKIFVNIHVYRFPFHLHGRVFTLHHNPGAADGNNT
jgi:L-arabinose isomerase